MRKTPNPQLFNTPEDMQRLRDFDEWYEKQGNKPRGGGAANLKTRYAANKLATILIKNPNTFWQYVLDHGTGAEIEQAMEIAKKYLDGSNIDDLSAIMDLQEL